MTHNHFSRKLVLTLIIIFFGSNCYNVQANSTDIPNRAPIKILNKINNKELIQKGKRPLKPSLNEVKKQLMTDSSREVAGKEERHLFYTIQTGSFIDVERAMKQFDSVMQGTFEKDLNHLRIEKVGKFYSVRLGKFRKYAGAEKLLQAIKPQLRKAIIMEAYIKDERIVKQYSINVSKEKEKKSKKENAFEVKTQKDIFRPSRPSIKGEPGKSLSLSPNERPQLFGTVITNNNKKLAIIKDRATGNTGLYHLNDKIKGFMISDIHEDKVILQKNDGLIKIWLRENKEFKSPEPVRTSSKHKKRRRFRIRKDTTRLK